MDIAVCACFSVAKRAKNSIKFYTRPTLSRNFVSMAHRNTRKSV